MASAVRIVLFLAFMGLGRMAEGAEPRLAPSQAVDWTRAAQLLAQCRGPRPPAAELLWSPSDGLPVPTDPRFAEAASRFRAQNPSPSPAVANEGCWTVEATASRQMKCLTFLLQSDDSSSTAHARRQCVASLAIEQARRLLWAFPVAKGRRTQLDRPLLAAATSLAVTGGLLDRAAEKDGTLAEVALVWMRTGLGHWASQDATEEPQRRAAAAEWMRMVGLRLDLEDLHGSDEAFFRQLDLTRPELATVAARVAAQDWPAARQAYVALLAARFASQQGWPTNDWTEYADRAEADDICRHIFILQNHMYLRHDFGAQVDWGLVIADDIETRVWMNAHPWMRTLLATYEASGDEKYLRTLCELFRSWYASSLPTFQRTAAQWRTLEVGSRAGQEWETVLTRLAEQPLFQRECLFEMARSMLDHGKYLAMYAASGGNWLQVEASGLATVALLFPEFRLSPLFYETAMNRLAWVNARAFLPDGFQSEGSPTYHYFPLMSIANAVRLAKLLQRPLPETLVQQYEAGIEALGQVTYPDGTLPMINDGDPCRQSARELFRCGDELFHRDDFRFWATGGREGKPPAECSHDFTHTGFCVMRDRWGPEGQMLLFDAGYVGSNHTHDDKLNFVFYAGGRELIGEPGIYAYKPDAFEPYWRGTWGHNTIVVDGLSQLRRLGPPEPMPDPDRRFIPGEGVDFAVSWYRRAYAPRGKDGQERAIRDVQHQRCLLYVKGQYTVVCDRVLGTEEHTLELIFHPAPVARDPSRPRAIEPVALEVRQGGTVVTTEAHLANVALIPTRMEGVTVRDYLGQRDPVRGWYALYGIVPSHDIVYQTRTRLPWQFETVVMPLPPGVAEPPRVERLPVETKASNAATALKVGDDLLLLSYDGPTEMSCGEVTFHGTALLLFTEGQQRKAAMVDGSLLRIGSRKPSYVGDVTPARTVLVEGR